MPSKGLPRFFQLRCQGATVAKKPLRCFSQKRTDILNNYDTVNLCLTLNPERVPTFFPLLQHGFLVKVQVGCSIKTMLCEQFELSPEYVESRINTIFMNGKVVDDIARATLKDGSTLALSAAMPGLVGATFRRGGPLAPLRSHISHKEEKTSFPQRTSMIVLKLFNLLINELGPLLLRKGIYIEREDFKSFLMSLPEEFWAGFKAATLDGQYIKVDDLRGMEWLDRYHLLMLQINCDI
jgi:hypothetical protein